MTKTERAQKYSEISDAITKAYDSFVEQRSRFDRAIGSLKQKQKLPPELVVFVVEPLWIFHGAARTYFDKCEDGARKVGAFEETAGETWKSDVADQCATALEVLVEYHETLQKQLLSFGISYERYRPTDGAYAVMQELVARLLPEKASRLYERCRDLELPTKGFAPAAPAAPHPVEQARDPVRAPISRAPTPRATTPPATTRPATIPPATSRGEESREGLGRALQLVLGAVFAAMTLLGIHQGLAAGGDGPVQRFLWAAFFSLGSAASIGFLGGRARMRGRLTLSKKVPLSFSATGGVATLFVCLALSARFYVAPHGEEEPASNPARVAPPAASAASAPPPAPARVSGYVFEAGSGDRGVDNVHVQAEIVPAVDDWTTSSGAFLLDFAESPSRPVRLTFTKDGYGPLSELVNVPSADHRYVLTPLPKQSPTAPPKPVPTGAPASVADCSPWESGPRRNRCSIWCGLDPGHPVDDSSSAEPVSDSACRAMALKFCRDRKRTICTYKYAP